LLASEYGWQIETIISLPSRHIFAFYEAIIRRRHEDKQFHASIHGVKIDDFDVLIKNSQPIEQLNSDQEHTINKALEKYFAQKSGE